MIRRDLQVIERNDMTGAQAFVEPRSADFIAWLRDHPATYESLIEQAQVARAWWEWPADGQLAGQAAGVRFDARHPPGNKSASNDRIVPVGHVYYMDGAWRGAVHQVDLDVTFDDPAVARDAVDARLRELDWTLVRGVVA